MKRILYILLVLSLCCYSAYPSPRTLTSYRQAVPYEPYSLDFSGGTVIANNSLVVNSNFDLNIKYDRLNVD